MRGNDRSDAIIVTAPCEQILTKTGLFLYLTQKKACSSSVLAKLENTLQYFYPPQCWKSQKVMQRLPCVLTFCPCVAPLLIDYQQICHSQVQQRQPSSF